MPAGAPLSRTNNNKPGMHELPDARPDASVTTPPEAQSLLVFWAAAGPTQWFAKNPAFDSEFRARFLVWHEAAARGALDRWSVDAAAALALVLLLDQFPRNAFRGTPRMFATDPQARDVAAAALEAGHDMALDESLRLFFYLPFAHSEELADQERSVALCRDLPPPNPANAQRHCDIIRRFGRFPHRNPILGRGMTAEEQRYLDEGGYAG